MYRSVIREDVKYGGVETELNGNDVIMHVIEVKAEGI